MIFTPRKILLRHGLQTALLAAALLFGPGGCVTANDAEVTVELLDATDKTDVSECLLLVIRNQSTEKKGYWWVMEEQDTGPLRIRSAEVRTISSGDRLHHPGYVVGLWGPYTRSQPELWEFWLFRAGYRPDDFITNHVLRPYKDQDELQRLLLRVTPGRPISDESVLDGARKLAGVADLLPRTERAARLIRLAIRQTEDVGKHSLRPRHLDDARELRAELSKLLADFPESPAETTKLPSDFPESPAGSTKLPAGSGNSGVKIPNAESNASPGETPQRGAQPVPIPPSPSTQPTPNPPALQPVDIRELEQN
jgi:hypothetical protein